MTEQQEFDARIVAMLGTHTYQQVADHFDVSRGRVWDAADRLDALKRGMARREARDRWRNDRVALLGDIIDAIKTADVLSYLGGIPRNTFNMHCTSPPYNVGKAYGADETADRVSFAFYLGWMIQVCAEMARTLVPGGVLFLQVGSTKDDDGDLYPLDCLLFDYLRSVIGLTFQTRIVWVQNHGLVPKSRPADRVETALVFSKGPVNCFFPTPGRTAALHPGKRAYKGPRKGQLSGGTYLGAWPTNVWYDNNVKNNHPERTGHPAQFPRSLARRAILSWTRPGDLVADVFSGSGTVADEAKRTGRGFAGCDLHYSDTRCERLAKVEPDLVSILEGVSDRSLEIWQAEAHPVLVPAPGRSRRTLDRLAA